MKVRKLIGSVALFAIFATMLMSCSAKGGAADMSASYAPTVGGNVLSGESYTEITETAFVNTADNASSYFSIDANTASYPNLRSIINKGYSVDKDSVRVEEMLNYFDYDYKTPTEDILSLSSAIFDNPYNPDTKLLTLGLAAEDVEFSKVKNNLVFLIDVSGSMYSYDKLPLVQQAFMLLTEGLNLEDRVSIVTYAGDDKVALEGAYGHEQQKIMAVIEDLTAGGTTAGSKGIKTAYEIAKKYFIEGGNNRVILATDGDFNVGISSTDDLADFIAEKRETGVYFSVYGFGRGNVQSDIMETLALNGNGTYGYIDSVKEARRALVSEIGGSIVTVAKDVKAGITFNPEFVESYRLIGYENKLLTEEEFEDSETDAGELGSGHKVTVVYEVTLVNNGIVLDSTLANVLIKYKDPDGAEEHEITYPVVDADYHTELTEQDKFIASVVEFALILRDSEYKASADLDALITRLDSLDLANDEFKSEFRDLVKTYRSNSVKEQ